MLEEKYIFISDSLTTRLLLDEYILQSFRETDDDVQLMRKKIPCHDFV